jgi:hypothetical protein
MTILDILAYAGAAVGWIGIVLCGIGVLRGTAQPNLASWVAWGTANAVFATLALLHGNTMSAGLNALAALGNFSILALCVVRRAGTRPGNATDWTCLALTASCLIGVVLSQGASYVAFLAMAANIAATWPTVQHAWRKPREEVWGMFAANIVANGFGLTGVIVSDGMGLSNIAGQLISTLGNVALLTVTIGRTLRTSVSTIEQEFERQVASEAMRLEGLIVAEMQRMQSGATIPDGELVGAGK